MITQVYDENWDDDMDNEKNKGKHPRWNFIVNIESGVNTRLMLKDTPISGSVQAFSFKF